MNSIVVSSTDFRRSSTKYFELATQGVKVLIKSGLGLFQLFPTVEEHEVSAEMLKKIEASRKEIAEGKCTTIRTKKELDEFFDTL